MSGIGIPLHSNSPISPVKLTPTVTGSATSKTSTSTATVPSNGQKSRPEISTTLNSNPAPKYVSDAPPPEPKAIPSALASATTMRPTVPPPPKSGEVMKHPEDHEPASVTQSQPYTSRMSAPPPRTAHGGQPPSSITPTKTDHFPRQSAEEISLQKRQVAPSHDLVHSTNQATSKGSLEHPPGYMQNPNASDMTPAQRFATENSNQASENSPILGYAARQQSSNAGFGEEDGVWDLAKKLVKSAGDTLAEGEKKAWDYINK
ncbi:MAG: hypothetical protein Q9214_006095 [Letrouitia sp. 1 TL-2023]